MSAVRLVQIPDKAVESVRTLVTTAADVAASNGVSDIYSPLFVLCPLNPNGM